jgi:two-component system sensor histidine kinase RpfC
MDSSSSSDVSNGKPQARLFQPLDTDFEQSLVRLVIALIVVAYLLIARGEDSYIETSNEIILAAVAYLLAALGIAISNIFYPGGFIARRAIAIGLDIFIVTYAMAGFDEAATPFFGGYLWLTIANGFRYGRTYLYVSNILCVGGFLVVLMVSDYWQSQWVLGYGLMFWLLVLPVYVSLLLKQLEGAIDTAKSASLAKSRFLTNMSHELRTPLNAIIGYSELLEEDARDENRTQTEQDLRRIRTAANHLLLMINEILDLSKIEAGRMQVYREAVDVEALFKEVAQTIRPDLDKNDNQLNIEIRNALPVLHTDMAKIRQVLLNLLSNANKFTESGLISMKAEHSGDSETPVIILSVNDTGIGMTPEQIARLFTPFTQAEISTNRIYGGTGLGLAISKYYCEMLGGNIHASSIPGMGTTMTVTLPVQTKSDSLSGISEQPQT